MNGASLRFIFTAHVIRKQGQPAGLARHALHQRLQLGLNQVVYSDCDPFAKSWLNGLTGVRSANPERVARRAAATVRGRCTRFSQNLTMP